MTTIPAEIPSTPPLPPSSGPLLTFPPPSTSPLPPPSLSPTVQGQISEHCISRKIHGGVGATQAYLTSLCYVAALPHSSLRIGTVNLWCSRSALNWPIAVVVSSSCLSQLSRAGAVPSILVHPLVPNQACKGINQKVINDSIVFSVNMVKGASAGKSQTIQQWTSSANTTALSQSQ